MHKVYESFSTTLSSLNFTRLETFIYCFDFNVIEKGMLPDSFNSPKVFLNGMFRINLKSLISFKSICSHSKSGLPTVHVKAKIYSKISISYPSPISENMDQGKTDHC